MTFNELLKTIEYNKQKALGDRLYEYLLMNFPQKDFDHAAQMMTDLIVNWTPAPITAEDWVLSTDFAYAQNLAQLLRARGILPPPPPKLEPVVVLVGEEIAGEEILFTTEFLDARPN